MSVHPSDLATELSTLLAGASLELHEALGIVAGYSREHTSGTEGPRIGTLTDLLLSIGARASTALEADRLAATRERNLAHYRAQQQRQHIIPITDEAALYVAGGHL